MDCRYEKKNVLKQSRKKATEKEKEALEKYLLQFLNIEKQFPLLPGVQNIDAVAGLMGLETEELLNLRSLFEENARQAEIGRASCRERVELCIVYVYVQ